MCATKVDVSCRSRRENVSESLLSCATARERVGGKRCVPHLYGSPRMPSYACVANSPSQPRVHRKATIFEYSSPTTTKLGLDYCMSTARHVAFLLLVPITAMPACHAMSQRNTNQQVQLAICVLGIYGCYLSLGMIQEGITTYRAEDGSRYSGAAQRQVMRARRFQPGSAPVSHRQYCGYVDRHCG